MIYSHNYSRLLSRALRGRRRLWIERHPEAVLVLVSLVILAALALVAG